MMWLSFLSHEVLKGRAKVELSFLTFHVLTVMPLISQHYGYLLTQKGYNEGLEMR